MHKIHDKKMSKDVSYPDLDPRYQLSCFPWALPTCLGYQNRRKKRHLET